ncbi:unnamed protein product [Arabis nemorensis]|uniref:Flavin-containing monooxygenase n=1 Tax=Arabis nemorensis TaxID=586526 RepID=A0A565BK77_9BRAS|nr:unnamed protein product [Arabis nemorensis]
MAQQSLSPIKSRHVAVIGAGATGLVTARELRREGHSVVVFERQNQVGGTWIYTDHVEPDPLSVDPTRPIVYSSVYSSLRTNYRAWTCGLIDFEGQSLQPANSKGPTRTVTTVWLSLSQIQ